MIDLLLLLTLSGAGWFVYDSLRARELARAAGRRACTAAGVQFLDDSVAGTHTSFARNHRGTLVFRRIYRFEFSDTGNNRKQGLITLRADRIESLEMEPWRDQVDAP